MALRGGRGTLRTYLGIAPGVGKTYEMLRDGRAAQRRGADVIAAYLERHGRPATAAQLGRLEILPTRKVGYRGTSFQELDTAALLARGPAIALVDELAHANLPGEAHAKRWQDVEDILAAGVDVYTTLNVANVASLSKLVAKLTGVRSVEPVPDSFVRAGEMRLVDLAPGALRQRLNQGLVFPKERADAALSSYFRFANLAALRELALLWLDNEVADAAQAFLAAHKVAQSHQPGLIVVGVDGSVGDEWLIRYAANLAEVSGAQLHGVHVISDASLGRRSAERLREDALQLNALGATFSEVRAGDIASGLIATAEAASASQLVVGSRGRSRWSRILCGSTVAELLREAGELPVQVVNVGRSSGPRRESGGDDSHALSAFSTPRPGSTSSTPSDARIPRPIHPDAEALPESLRGDATKFTRT
jgi:two-component system sensor histidine kinase KdpD